MQGILGKRQLDSKAEHVRFRAVTALFTPPPPGAQKGVNAEEIRANSLSFEKIGGFPGGSAGEESTCNAGDLGSIPGLGRSPGEGKGYPLQYFGLENSMDCIVHWVAKSQTRLRNFHFHFILYMSDVLSLYLLRIQSE